MKTKKKKNGSLGNRKKKTSLKQALSLTNK